MTMTMIAMYKYSTMSAFLTVLISILFRQVYSFTIDDSTALLLNKTRSYNKMFRPTYNQSVPFVVDVGLAITSIQNFDEVQEKLTITGFLMLSWTDEFMKWYPNSYGGMTDVLLESGQFWTPNIVLMNNINKLEKIGETWQVIRFTHEGFARYYPGDVFSATCNADVTYYPWDYHLCPFTFNTWGYLPREVRLNPTSKVDMWFFDENGAWDLLDTSVSGNGYTGTSFHLKIKRKPRFILINVIMPIIVLAFLNVMVFCVAPESGERISYSITVLLAIAVFMTYVGESLPKTSSPISLFSIYMLVIFIVSTCITVATLFSLKLYYLETPLTGMWVCFTKCLQFQHTKYKKPKGTTLDLKKKIQSGHQDDPMKDTKADHSGENSIGDLIAGKEVMEHSRKTVYSCTSDNGSICRCTTLDQHGKRKSPIHILEADIVNTTADDNNVTGKDVAIALDKLFFVFFSLILLTSTTALFSVILSSDVDK